MKTFKKCKRIVVLTIIHLESKAFWILRKKICVCVQTSFHSNRRWESYEEYRSYNKEILTSSLQVELKSNYLYGVVPLFLPKTVADPGFACSGQQPMNLG